MEYLERTKISKYLEAELNYCNLHNYQERAATIRSMLDIINNLSPDITSDDFTSIIRCKNCKNFEHTLCGWCNTLERAVALDDYCSYGEEVD